MDAAQSERLVASLISLLEQGVAPWRREWDASGAGHHVNLRSGRRYRGSNPILLTLGMHARGSLLPYWCGWGEARALGLSPRQGAKAVMVLRPQPHRRPRRRVDLEPSLVSARASASNAQPADSHTWISYHPVPLFNAADLVGETLPSLLQARSAKALVKAPSEPLRLAAAETVLRAWPVELMHGSERPCYLPGADRIVLPVRCRFHSAAAYYATWAHEMVHSTGHASRLARDFSGAPGSAAYAREELVAELGSVLLGDRLEIGSDLTNHASYLGSWIAMLKETPTLLLEILKQARQAVDLIAPEDGAEAKSR